MSATEWQQLLQANFETSIAAKQAAATDGDLQKAFAEAVALLLLACQNGQRIYIAGNGGSAADAQHLAAEFICRLAKNRPPIAAESLCVDPSVLTGLSNDYGFAKVFARQLEAKLRPGDLFIALTTSGQSENINHALAVCRQLGNQSILLAGRDGGASRTLADICLLAPGTATHTIQEVHQVLYHSLCEAVESGLFPEARP